MSEVEVKISGLNELQAKLEAMPHQVAERVIKHTLQEVGNEMALRFFENAPRSKDPAMIPGFLASHFVVEFHDHGSDLAGSVKIGPTKTDYPRRGHKMRKQFRHTEPVEGSTVTVDSVARFLEFGTSRMAAHPFMTAAFEGFKNEALDEIIADIKDAIEAAAKS